MYVSLSILRGCVKCGEERNEKLELLNEQVAMPKISVPEEYCGNMSSELLKDFLFSQQIKEKKRL